MYLALVVLLAVVLIALLVRGRLADQESALSGYWVADPDFLKASGLSGMTIYLAPAERGVRSGYLVAAAGDAATASTPITWRAASGPARWLRAALGRRVWDVDLAPAGRQPRLPLPGRLSARLDAAGGTLVLEDGKRVHALLHRDAVASGAAREAERELAARS